MGNGWTESKKIHERITNDRISFSQIPVNVALDFNS